MQRIESGRVRNHLAFFALACVAGLAACAESGPKHRVCPLAGGSGDYRIEVTVVDGSGSVVEDELLLVEASPAGAETWTPCFSGEFNGTQRWGCGGFDEPGRYDVRATLGDRSGLSSGIRIARAPCDINTVEVDVVLQ